MVLEQLQKIGQRLTKLFGGSDATSSSMDQESLKEVFSGSPLASILPYEAYDEEHGIFIGKNSLGFAIEVVTLAGSDEVHQKEINSLFEEVLEEGASIQCLLFADHRIDPFIEKWKDSKKQKEEIYHAIAEKRAQHFKMSNKLYPRIYFNRQSFLTSSSVSIGFADDLVRIHT